MAITAVQDWDNDGFLAIKGEGTLKRYLELTEQKSNVPLDKFGVFVAFNKKQFDEGYAGIVKSGQVKDGEKIYHLFGGCYGTRDGYTRLCAYYDGIDEIIKSECDPQEVYFYEYNNYECCIASDGDHDAMKELIMTFGKDAVLKVKRFRPMYSVAEIADELEGRK
nr:MAG TPA: hypothetical protein [Caudoviricetes sp.]